MEIKFRRFYPHQKETHEPEDEVEEEHCVLDTPGDVCEAGRNTSLPS